MYCGESYIKKAWDEKKDYLYPIPIQERLLNTNLTQNPGGMMVYDWRNGKRVVFLQLVKKGYNMKRSVVFAACLWVSCLFR